MPVDAVIASKKIVNLKEYYNTARLRPHFSSFEMKPLFIMTSETLRLFRCHLLKCALDCSHPSNRLAGSTETISNPNSR